LSLIIDNVAKLHNVPPERIILKLDGLPLSPQQTVKECGICNGDVIEASLTEPSIPPAVISNTTKTTTAPITQRNEEAEAEAREDKNENIFEEPPPMENEKPRITQPLNTSAILTNLSKVEQTLLRDESIASENEVERVKLKIRLKDNTFKFKLPKVQNGSKVISSHFYYYRMINFRSCLRDFVKKPT
jgi:hypothetical protein